MKLLILLPFAPDLRGSNGGSRATAAIIDMLSQRHRVSVLYLSAPNDPSPRELPGNCERALAIPIKRRGRSAVARSIAPVRQFLWGRPGWAEDSWSLAVADRVREAAAELQPDVAQFEFHVMAEYIPAVRAACPNAACLVTEHEPGVTADLGRDSLTFKQWLGGLARRRAWSRYERRVLRLADTIIVFTKSDETALRDLLGPSSPPISVIPLRLPEPGRSRTRALPTVKSDFVFVGNFRHPPNVDAANRLVRSIFPMIVRELPEATLTIVGADPPADLVEAATDRVTVTGWVDDPAIYLNGAAAVLVPLRQGGGLRVKMLEACAAGKAIIASQVAVEGLSVRDGQQVIVAGTDEEFAARAVALLRDPAERDRLQRASRKWWKEEQDVGRWAAQYDQVFDSLRKTA